MGEIASTGLEMPKGLKTSFKRLLKCLRSVLKLAAVKDFEWRNKRQSLVVIWDSLALPARDAFKCPSSRFLVRSKAFWYVGLRALLNVNPSTACRKVISEVGCCPQPS